MMDIGRFCELLESLEMLDAEQRRIAGIRIAVLNECDREVAVEAAP